MGTATSITSSFRHEFRSTRDLCGHPGVLVLKPHSPSPPLSYSLLGIVLPIVVSPLPFCSTEASSRCMNVPLISSCSGTSTIKNILAFFVSACSERATDVRPGPGKRPTPTYLEVVTHTSRRDACSWLEDIHFLRVRFSRLPRCTPTSPRPFSITLELFSVATKCRVSI